MKTTTTIIFFLIAVKFAGESDGAAETNVASASPSTVLTIPAPKPA